MQQRQKCSDAENSRSACSDRHEFIKCMTAHFIIWNGIIFLILDFDLTMQIKDLSISATTNHCLQAETLENTEPNDVKLKRS